MRATLVWTVRVSGVVGWFAAAVACWWLLGVAYTPRPWTGPLVGGAVVTGCAVVRAAALWGLRRGHARVDLEKASGAFESVGWVRARAGALWLLLTFACGALFVGLMTAGMGNERVAELRDAGARVSTATVVESPRAVREDLSEDVVRGYTSRLVVAVPDGPERLATRAYTHDRPRTGTEVEVLWAPSAPELGGYVHERESLRTLAAGRWEAFPEGANGRDALVAFILAMVTIGLFALVFTFTAGPRALQELAWSAPVQTFYAVLVTAVFAGWRPLLTGDPVSPVEGLLGVGGFGILVLTYMFMAGRTIGES
ncbi:hypothetical protein ABZ896_34850 [Streptomyces sp. NPDC047072]|uniref:hypothetical protein n=1 Tax=Streptomyces sp. NPDC047072 TaxID=3154809 RepID=UPI0033CBDF91